MKAKSAGFTLTELMFVIVIGALLVTLGLPSFRDFIRSSRMTSLANDMVADYNLARSEAVKRRVPVSLCQSPDGATCEETAGEDLVGWIVFIDDADPLVQAATDGNGAVDDEEEIIRVRAVPESIQAKVDGLSTTFLASGFPDPDSDEPMRELVFCDERGNQDSVGGVSAARGLQVSATGRTTVSRDTTFIEDELGGCPP